jgi:hypothetical protein
MTDASNPLKHLLEFLDHLESNKVTYYLDHERDSILVIVALPGDRWEVEFFPDDRVEVERFTSSGEIGDEVSFRELWERLPERDS